MYRETCMANYTVITLFFTLLLVNAGIWERAAEQVVQWDNSKDGMTRLDTRFSCSFKKSLF